MTTKSCLVTFSFYVCGEPLYPVFLFRTSISLVYSNLFLLQLFLMKVADFVVEISCHIQLSKIEGGKVSQSEWNMACFNDVAD